MIQVDTSGIRLTDRQEADLRRLFYWIARTSMEPDKVTGRTLRGSIVIPFKDGNVGAPKVESIHDLNGNGKEPELLMETKTK